MTWLHHVDWGWVAIIGFVLSVVLGAIVSELDGSAYVKPGEQIPPFAIRIRRGRRA